MSWNSARTESMRVGWDFYERTINNYSIIMRIMELEEKDLLISEVPRIFIEESFFDMCEVIVNDGGVVRQGFCAIDGTFDPIDHNDIINLKAKTGKSTVTDDQFGYGTIYIYMIKRNLGIIGYLVLGKRYRIELRSPQIRELEIIGEIYGMALMLGLQTAAGSVEGPMFETVLESFPDPLVLS